MEKALREAKRNTNWVEPNAEWEAAVKRFCRGAATRTAGSSPTSSRSRRGSPRLGERAALGQLVLKLTAPGVPDIYQGDELPFRALVDPDNRRPVDWDWCQAMLAPADGRLATDRRDHEAVRDAAAAGAPRAPARDVRRGSYEPLDAGARRCAFVRGGEVLVAVAVRAGGLRRRSTTPRGRWRDVLRGEERSFDARERLASLARRARIRRFREASGVSSELPDGSARP